MSSLPDLGHVQSLPRRSLVTTRTHEAFALALRLAERLGHDDVTDVHIVLGMLRERRNMAVAALHCGGVALEVLERDLEALLPPEAPSRPAADELSWTPGIERMLGLAINESRELGTEYYGCEHVLLAIVRDSTSASAQVLARHGFGYEEAKSAILQVYNARPDA